MKTIQEVLQLFPETKAAQWAQHANGNGWVFYTARADTSSFIAGILYGNAQVSGDARVYGNARVSGNARVYGNAQVSGDARVSGDAWVLSPLYVQGTRHSITLCSYTELAIGCKVLTLAQWKNHYKAIGEAEGYTPAQIKEYGEYIAMFVKAAKRYRVKE